MKNWTICKDGRVEQVKESGRLSRQDKCVTYKKLQ